MRSLQTWEYFESRDKDNRGNEDIHKAIKYLFEDGNKSRSLVAAYEHVIKHVANVKNNIQRPDNPSTRIE